MRLIAFCRQALGKRSLLSGLRTYATAGELSEGTSSFWTDIDIKDLPGSDVDAEVLRRHNTSFPFYRKQVVVGKVIGVERDHVAIYTGHRVLTRFAKKELHLSQLVRSRNAAVREGPKDFKVGDVLHLMLDELETPFGDVGLRVAKWDDERQRLDAVFSEVEEHHRTGTPLRGRILNAVNKGYSVGVAGLTCFLPFSLCSLLTASKVGVLQPFLVNSLKRSKMEIVLADPSQVAEQEQRRRSLMNRSRQPFDSSATGAYATNRALRRDQLQMLVAHARRWQAEDADESGKRPEFPNALLVAQQVCTQRQYHLSRLQLEHLITNVRAELSEKRYNEFLRVLRSWNIDPTCRILTGSKSQAARSSTAQAARPQPKQ